ncbi:tRNA nucleotidyltransferase/poly(A) polymerase [Vibrio phage 2.275.O._10N.286.54.E11]|nr:tRNA nucleotidyltransferase/poly(A) polymerase [Vibrio phage 2.275.O._10N.286.54.E11]
MKKFLVGGAVRDHQLGLKVKDRDWLIVGAKQHHIDKMIKDGYEQVGNDFPVFLHPDTREEYALARTERKNGVGYNGFVCNADSSVTLEDDLLRRDLTINAMAFNPYTQETHDPYGGTNDLKNKILRHVSPAFAEDPVRVLRTARFAARYSFDVHDTTTQLMREMALSGELDHLTSERVMAELQKVAEERGEVSLFFKVLSQSGALTKIFPGITITNDHLKVVDKAVQNSSTEDVFEILLATTFLHTDQTIVADLHKKYKFPSKTFRFMNDCVTLAPRLYNLHKLTPKETVELFDAASLRNKGGEKYVYLLLDVMFALGLVQRNDYEETMRYYDQFYSTNLSNIDELCKENGSDWAKNSLKKYIFDEKCKHMAKLY